MVIYQFTPTITLGDGVSQGVHFVAQLLTELSLSNRILAADIHPALSASVLPYHQIQPTEQDVLLYHHSVGLEVAAAEWVTQFPGKRLLIYHNITPAFFFPEGSAHHYACTLGRSQLAEWSPLFQASLADSDYNKRELDNIGYPNTQTLPLLFDLQQLQQRAAHVKIATVNSSGAFRLLFVGRIAPNKCQHQLIELLPYLQQKTTLPITLTLVGGVSTPDYNAYLQQRIQQLQLTACVHLAGKVEDTELGVYYQQADCFVSLSEHEGFGIPLIEAMVHQLPVVAYPAGAIASTLAGSGLLLTGKYLPQIAEQLLPLIENSGMRQHIVRQQNQRLTTLNRGELLTALAQFLTAQGVLSCLPAAIEHGELAAASVSSQRWQIQGPLDSSYSLALVNRELAKALQQQQANISLYQTEGLGDYPLDRVYLQQHDADLLPFIAEHQLQGENTVVIRNLYPPRLTDNHAETLLLGPYGWEESAFPSSYVQQINTRAHGVLAMSQYVAKVLVDNGVRVPIVVTGLGADHILYQPAEAIEIPWYSDVRFLHVSSAFARKGIDLLIDAYTRAFAPWQSAQLVIKTFANPHNNTAALLEKFGWTTSDALTEPWQVWRRSRDDQAPIVVVWQSLSMAQMRWLYEQSSALVAPTRGEGFGLPQAEAMFCRCPVITTDAGGHTDFCTPETAWLIDSRPVSAQTHMALSHSMWFEPDVIVLIQLLTRFAMRDAELALTPRLDAAYRMITTHYTWQATAQRTVIAQQQGVFAESVDSPNTKLGLVTTWHQRCGIATYGQLLSSRFPVGQWQVLAPYESETTQPDEAHVSRCWQLGQTDALNDLWNALNNASVTHLLIQFNFGFFRLSALHQLLVRCRLAGIPVFMTLHATQDVPAIHGAKSLRELLPELKHVHLFVHGLEDVQRLYQWGLRKVSLFPHGVIAPLKQMVPTRLDDLLQQWQQAGAQVLASYGYLLPHKGILELIAAFEQLKPSNPQLRLLLLNARYPAPASTDYAQQCQQAIANSRYQQDIQLLLDYTHDDEALSILTQCNFIVMPYQHTQESSSAAVRFALASCRPVFVTPLNIFDDVKDQVITLADTHAQAIAQGILRYWQQSDKQLHMRQTWLLEHHWSTLSQRMWHTIRCAKN
ncbi:MAG: glycosyltransferase [Thiotrichales bacterium]|jgi:glycosyltransferase involved in cell wall biosynthesis|nr:glycosyltransferase [Thiotrichales bacterium]